MTPRERDPQVWAAAYSDFFNRALAAAYSAADGGPDERMAAAIAAVDVERCKLVADAAVMALHPDGTYTAPDGTVLREPVDEGPASDRV